VPELNGLDKATWLLISSIYRSTWDLLHTDKENKIFRYKVASKFTSNTHSHNPISDGNKSKNKSMEIIKLSSSIPARLSKEILEKSKFFKKEHKSMKKVKPNTKLSYAQVLTPKVSDILKIKENYPSLSVKRIKNIYKIINDSSKSKSRVNMTTKDPLRKLIIVSIGNDNKTKFITLSSDYIANLNRAFKNIKLNIMADYTCMNQNNIIIITNKVTFLLDL